MEWVPLPLCGYLIYLCWTFRRLPPGGGTEDPSESSQIKGEVTQAVLLALLGKISLCVLFLLELDSQAIETLIELWALIHFGLVYAALYRLTELLSTDRMPEGPLYHDKCLVWTSLLVVAALFLVLGLGSFPNRLEFCLFFAAEVYLGLWTFRTHRIFRGVERSFTHPFELTADRKELRKAVISPAPVDRLYQLRLFRRPSMSPGLLSPGSFPGLPLCLPPPHQSH